MTVRDSWLSIPRMWGCKSSLRNDEPSHRKHAISVLHPERTKANALTLSQYQACVQGQEIVFVSENDKGSFHVLPDFQLPIIICICEHLCTQKQSKTKDIKLLFKNYVYT